ncbi:MAG: DUF21 domain-containing protein [Rhodocyclaceae bacterium]|nr:DUF21 domain-containing protein [Rhodocyclaceae bacterium]
MPEVSLSVQIGALALLLVFSGLFSMAETTMMASNRYRLRSMASAGHRGAELALELLNQTEKLLGVILLFNNLVNAAAATLTGVIALELFGEERWALGAGTLLITFLILVFSEITPKVIGARYANQLAVLYAFPLAFLLRASYFAVWFVNLFVAALLRLIGLHRDGNDDDKHLSTEELRAMVLEAGHVIPTKHRSILLNMFELEDITVEDVMIPRGAIESIDLSDPIEDIRQQIATSYHTRLPVFDGETDDVIGILHLRRMLGHALDNTIDHAALREMITKPYFIPADTPVYSQLQFFQENKQRMGLVVDEYGELLGMVALEDIIEEMIGKFTTSAPDNADSVGWQDDDSVLVDGAHNLRELNRKLGLNLPLDGPKTLNGLIVEYLQDIPETGLSVRIGDVPIEVVQTQDRMVKTARLFKPEG